MRNFMDCVFRGSEYILSRTFHDRLLGLVQNTGEMDGHIKHLVYCVENAILNLPIGQEQIILLADFKGWGIKYSTPIKTAREATNILQNHYPERLHVAILFNPPRVFETFWTVRLWLRILLYLQDLHIRPDHNNSMHL